MRRVAAVATGLALSALATLTAGAQPQWRLVEELRIGGDSSDEKAIFTDIRGIVAGPQGQIFVLDWRAQELRLFSRTGQFTTLVARSGKGPGEIDDANGLLLLRDTVWANDPQNGRWSAWSAAEGRYLRQITIPIVSHSYLWDAGVDREGRILDIIFVPGRSVGADGRPVWDRWLRRVRTDGQVADSIPFPECVRPNFVPSKIFTGSTSGPRGGGMNMAIPFLPRPVVALDGTGGYWCSPNDEYVIIHRSLDTRDTLHTVRAPHTRLAVTSAERDAAVESAKKALARYQVVDADYSLIPKVHPVFHRLDVDDRGQLWARRVTAPGAPLAFDIFDNQGRRVASTTTTVPFVETLPIHVRGEHVYGVVRDADDVPYVVRTRIVRR